MPEAAPATAAQLAMFGHIATAIREAMARKQWKPGDLNRALGKAAGDAGVYKYLSGKGAPIPVNARKLAKALGISPDALVKRRLSESVVGEPTNAVVRVAGAVRAPDPILMFATLPDGTARIKLDVSGPIAEIVPLLRMLLDAGMVIAP
jgi:hypothetical protein